MSRKSTLVSVVLSSCFFSVLAYGPASAAGPDLDHAKSVVEAHSRIPDFVPPGPPFKARECMAGKKLLSIPTSSAIPFVDGIESSMTAVAKDVGFTFQQWKNQGRPTQWVQGMDFGANNKFDGIDLMGGIIPSSLAPQVAAANKAGVKVFASHYSDTSQPADPGVAVTLKLPFHEVGEIIGNWITLKTGGKANVLIIGSDDVIPSRPYSAKLAETLDTVCGAGCKHRYVNVTLADWSSKIQTTVQSALIADPTINYVVPLYDSMAQFVLPALTITGHKKDVKIATFNGTPFIVDMVRKGDVEMDVGESLGWIARSTLDGEMRNLCGLPSGDTLNVPLYIFSSDNAKDAGVPATFDKGYGDKHIGGFAKLWGLE
ncbi:sugar ABC transporter substrate-binding protein [Labrys monachus]|uniref:Ribose transport system substrate-binding protein n=1 Tax=Labrys monachus TaxID=217067 RepID=A0ABU0FFG3_9HYPH|nr:substrate-binding domain-containing protein [Labrys monachus]MDQ0393354.1 ribose transport system substrate-binding protein [Labrys monachus]